MPYAVSAFVNVLFYNALHFNYPNSKSTWII